MRFFIFFLTLLLLSTFSCTKKEPEKKTVTNKTQIDNFSLSGIDSLSKKNFLLKAKTAEIKEDKVFLSDPDFRIFKAKQSIFTLNSKKGIYNKKENEFSFNSAKLFFDSKLEANSEYFIFKEKTNEFNSPKVDITYFKNKLSGNNFHSDTKLELIKLKNVKALLNY